MAVSIHFTGNCGINELCGISCRLKPEGVMKDISWYFKKMADHERVAFFVFTGVTKERKITQGHSNGRTDDYGQAFADYIEANGLGKVTSSEPRTNWSGNDIKMWIWHLDWDAIIPFVKVLYAKG